MLTVEILKEYGADTDDGISRCMGNESLYLRLVSSVVGQTEFEDLERYICAGDLKKAFESAHALKGVLGNLSLTPLYEKICEITDLLRVQTDMDYKPLLEQISGLRDEIKNMIE
jgi:HPt (histidine-containing phosphotransfer) domain-containing protein